MEGKTFTGGVPQYEANPSHPPPGPAGYASPMHTGAYDTTTPAVTYQDPYNQGPPPSHPPPSQSPPADAPTHYPHQPISPPPDSQAHYANQPPPGSPPPQIAHASPPITHAQPSPAMASPGQEKTEYYNATEVPQQTGIPMQDNRGIPPPQQSGGYGLPAQVYHTVTPLQSLSQAPAPVDCPVCHTRAMTRVEQHSGNTTHAWAALVCCLLGLGCIPYLIRGLKDTEQYCGHCGVMLATYHNSGRTVVHQHG